MGCALIVAACACGGGPDDPVDGVGVTALFAVPREGAPVDDFYALPFPNDIRRTADGRVDLRAYSRNNVLLALYADASARLDGFGLNAAIHLRFTGGLDPATLPATPEASLADDASVYLVDIDPDSAARGARVPLRVRFQPDAGRTIGANVLAALPYPGFPLAEGTTYALVVSSRVGAAGGGAVAPADDFRALLADDAAMPAAARAAYAPLGAWLDEAGGDARADVVTAAVFTTQHATSIMPLLRTAVRALPAPRLRALVGFDNPENLAVVDAVFDGPNFQRGVPPYTTAGSGDIVIAGGKPVVQRTEALRVSLCVPRGAAPASGWPIAIYAHGTGGDYHSYLDDGTAGRLAAAGIASISIDQVLHGPRNPDNDPSTSFFNVENPLAARDNPIQGALDDFSVVRLIESVAAAPPASPTGVALDLDPARIYFFGHSQGGLTGPPFIAAEPLVKGAVLSGAGGLLYESLVTKTEPVDITALAAALIGDDVVDEFNPALALLQMWVERSDPVNFAPLLVRQPLPGMAPRPIFQSEGLVDHFTPPPTIEALATALGGNQVAPTRSPIAGLTLRERRVLTAPVSGNLGGVTAVLLQYAAPADSDGHFVVFDVPAAQRQSVRFLATLAATGKATLEVAR